MPKLTRIGTAEEEIEKVRGKLGGFNPFKTPHIAIDMGGGRGLTIIPISSRINIVWDPTQEGGIIPLVLAGISKSHLDFVAFSSSPQNRRSMRAKFKWAGKFQTGYRSEENLQRDEKLQKEGLLEDE